MNSDLMRRWLNLQIIPEDAQQLYLVWERPLPPWLWAIVIIGGGLFAIWSYSRLTGWRPGRGALAAIRFMTILLVTVILCGPMLQMPRETVEEDWVLLLVDRSASMQIEDVMRGESGRISREQQLREILEENWNLLASLDEQKQLVWLGFHAGAFSLPSLERDDAQEATDRMLVDLGLPDGRRTSIGMSIEQALQRAAARPLSGIVLLSDGRTTDPPGRSLMRRLQADAIPVFTVPLGSREPLADLAIRRIDAPRRAFIRDKVPVTVQVDRLGDAARAIGGTIRLVDEETGEELASDELQPGDEREEILLVAEPRLAGDARWRIEIDSEQPTLVPENTVRSFGIELIDRPLRVLFVDGYPRWEYRYVKNLLIREESIESSIMLLSADRDFAQEGNQPITRLPRSPGEFAEFDVIVLGDVPGTFFSHSQLEMMRDHVAERGAGLLWIAGERFTPQTYVGTPLADLLPVRGSLELPSIPQPVLMEPTDLANRLGVLNLVLPGETGWPRELTDASYGWSQLRWAQRLERERLKPTAEVLARTTEPIDGAHLPLVTLMRYGAGRSIYVATDEIWRWRFGRGELLPEQFWVQMLRMLGREILSGTDVAAVLEVSPRRVQTGQPLRIELQILDARLADAAPPSVAVVIEDERSETIATIELQRIEGTDPRYAGTFIPDRPGTLRFRADEPSLRDQSLIEQVEVFTPDDELRRPETDHELLRALAEGTGGRMLEPDEFASLPELLPDRSVTTDNPLTERIWDTPLFFALVLLLLTMEWVGRKVLRLI